MGLVLLGAAGFYYGYGVYADSRLEELKYSEQVLTSLPPEAREAGFRPPEIPSPALTPTPFESLSLSRVPRTPALDTYAEKLGTAPLASSPRKPAPAEEAALDAFPASSYASIYPGVQMHPKYWDRPRWAGTDVRTSVGLPEGFRAAVATNGQADAATARALALRIRIPIIEVDSGIAELGIIDLADSRAYETPKNIVGHIPETSQAGALGNAWFFGHLESPIRGEGSVFRDLPKIPKHLNEGDPVYVTLESDDAEYLYQVTATDLVHEDDLRLYGSEEATISLVTCYPRLRYDHRLIVTARLIGIKGKG